MQCLICGSESKKLFPANTHFNSKVIGNTKVSIPNSICSKCGNDTELKLISKDLAEAIQEFVYLEEQKAISNLPFNQFVSCGQAAQFLGITKQAVYKIIKTRRRVLMTSIIDDKFYIYINSLEEYKKTGSGRVSISGSDSITITSSLIDASLYNATDASCTEDENRYCYCTT